ncbi:MAG: dicarboxylate/amino acid:cation symporter [Firmicutes bacterium]|nr:dicarboxylate/amino acid:cation symporter [Bacillota bacterium]
MDQDLRQVKESFWKNYGFVISMMIAIVLGTITGLVWPGATVLSPLGDLFINMMFCVVVPMVFCSIASAIANMKTPGRAGKVMGVTTVTFLATAAIAAVVMYIVVRCINIVPAGFSVDKMVTSTEDIADITPGQLIVNFFTKPDFGELLSRRAMLPLIVAAILFGFGIQLSGGPETRTAAMLEDLTACIMKTVKIITFYAPIGFFGFFANLAATYGPELMGGYAKTLIVYYVMCFVYMFLFFPLYARFGGGKGGAGVMWKHLFKPAAVAFGTCSSVATIPTNMEAAQETGISKDVSEIVLPLGATMHMDGSAMSAIVKVAFLFGISGMDFGTGKAVIAIVVAIFASVAMSGIPGGGGVGELVLCSIFFNNSPEQLTVAYTLALAIGNLVDPPATMVNAAGDYVVSFIVSKYVDGKDWLQKQLSR